MTLGGGLAIVGELGLVIVATTSQLRRENITLLLDYHSLLLLYSAGYRAWHRRKNHAGLH